MDSRKAANWAQIIGTLIAAALLGYVVWDHWPTANQSSVGVEWGGIMTGYVPPAVIALLLLASSTLQFILWRRRRAKRSNDSEPSVEIVSPFDSEEVGLYETVRGRVFPSDRYLQVFVFAGDNKWYLQRHLAVSGTKWSVKCQFGNPDTPSAGVYKIAAVLDSHLNEGMWYADLPNGVRSNVITVHRPEITIEQKLSGALKDAEEATGTIEVLRADLDKARGDSRAWERKYHKVNNEKILVERDRDNYKNQIAELRRDLATSEEGHELVLTTERIEKNMLKEDLEGAKHDLKNANLRANEETREKDTWYDLSNKHEARLADWAFLIKLAGEQARAIGDFVVITDITPTHFNLDIGADRIAGVTLQILNNSVFDITISPAKVKGHFHFENKPRKEPVHVPIDADHLPIEKLKPNQPAKLYIEQPLLTSEAERISEANDHTPFWLGSLSIPITLENVPPEIKFKQDVDIRIPPELVDIPIFHFFL